MTGKQLYGWLRKVTAKQLHAWLRDAGLVAGAASVVYGVAQWSPPAAWIAAGLALLALSTAASRAAVRQQRKKGTP